MKRNPLYIEKYLAKKGNNMYGPDRKVHEERPNRKHHAQRRVEQVKLHPSWGN